MSAGNFLLSDNDKNLRSKKKMLRLCINQDYTITELSNELDISIPTITKLMTEMIDDG